MGEAKRRKILDPNYGKADYEITFYGFEDCIEPLKIEWEEANKIQAPFAGFKFVYRGESIFGLSFLEIKNNVVALDYQWCLHPERITKQTRIVNTCIEIVNQENLKKFTEAQIDINAKDLDVNDISKVFSKSSKGEFSPNGS